MMPFSLTIPTHRTSVTQLYMAPHAMAALDQYWPESLKGRPVLLITDPQVHALYGASCEAVLAPMASHMVTYQIPQGEQAKHITALSTYIEGITAALAEAALQLTREWVVVGFGGGVVGDIAGFLASTLLRGLRLVLLPTTLMAQVDSAIGGKNGMHSQHMKHALGSFYMPDLVLVDPELLMHLEPRQFRSGVAEIVKYALLGAPGLLPLLQEECLTPSHAALPAVIQACMAYKAQIVTQDPFEQLDTGRILLNFGHSFGHALESYYQFDSARITHGEAVALGMMWATHISAQLGYCTDAEVMQVQTLLVKQGLPFQLRTLSDSPTLDILVTAMQHDKKNTQGSLRLLLNHGIGKIEPHDCSTERLLSLLGSLGAML